LILAAADSTIEQTIRLQTNQLKPAAGNDDIEQIIEERRKKAVLQIERMRLENKRTGDASKKPHLRRNDGERALNWFRRGHALIHGGAPSEVSRLRCFAHPRACG
jgi:hypothetical protein